MVGSPKKGDCQELGAEKLCQKQTTHGTGSCVEWLCLHRSWLPGHLQTASALVSEFKTFPEGISYPKLLKDSFQIMKTSLKQQPADT